MNRAVDGAEAQRKSVMPDQRQQIAQDPEIGMGHELPHQGGDRGCDHQGQQEGDREHVVEPGRAAQQEGDAQAQHEFDANGEHGVEQRNPHRVPEGAALEQLDVLLEPDEPAHHGQVHVVALQRIPDGGAEGYQDADADHKGWQRQEIGQRRAAEALLRNAGDRNAGRRRHEVPLAYGVEAWRAPRKAPAGSKVSRGRPA